MGKGGSEGKETTDRKLAVFLLLSRSYRGTIQMSNSTRGKLCNGDPEEKGRRKRQFPIRFSKKNKQRRLMRDPLAWEIDAPLGSRAQVRG